MSRKCLRKFPRTCTRRAPKKRPKNCPRKIPKKCPKKSHRKCPKKCPIKFPKVSKKCPEKCKPYNLQIFFLFFKPKKHNHQQWLLSSLLTLRGSRFVFQNEPLYFKTKHSMTVTCLLACFKGNLIKFFFKQT